METAKIIKVEGDKMWAGEWHKSDKRGPSGQMLWHRNGQTNTQPINASIIERLSASGSYAVTVIK